MPPEASLDELHALPAKRAHEAELHGRGRDGAPGQQPHRADVRGERGQRSQRRQRHQRERRRP